MALTLPVETVKEREAMGRAARDALRALAAGGYENGSFTATLIFAAPDAQYVLWNLPLLRAIDSLPNDVSGESLFEILEGLAEGYG